MKRTILILIICLSSLYGKSQSLTYVILNIDSGAHVDTVIGYSNNPFFIGTLGCKGYYGTPSPLNNYSPYFMVHAGFAPKGIYPKISIIVSNNMNLGSWTYGIVYQITIHGPFAPNHTPNYARWYGNNDFRPTSTLYPSPTGPTVFSGEGQSFVKCSTDSTDIKHISISFKDIIY